MRPVAPGAVAAAAVPKVVRAAKPVLVDASFETPATWVIGVEVPSLANSRDSRVRSRVAQTHRRAVSRALGKELWAVAVFAFLYHRGESVTVALTRLGGRAMDRADNLPASLKYLIDGVALMLGADDGDERFVVRCEQEPGGGCGVKIQLTSGGN